MAVVGSAKLDLTGWRGSAMIGAREFAVPFIVITDDKDDGPAVALSAPGLPPLGAFYGVGNDVSSFAIHVRCDVTSVTPLKSGQRFSLVCNYSTVVEDLRAWQLPSPEASPLDEPPLISMQNIEYTRQQDWHYRPDNTKEKLVTAAGEPFTIEVPYSRPQLTYRRNESTAGDAIGRLSEFLHTRNADALGSSIGAGKALMQDITFGTPRWKSGVEFVEVTYIIELDEHFHLLRQSDVGTWERGDKGPVRVQLADGTFATSPVPIARFQGSGFNFGQAIYPTMENPFPDYDVSERIIEPYRMADWSPLNLVFE